MIAPLKQFPLPESVDSADRALPRIPRRNGDRIALYVWALGFLSFLPYPALNVGNATAVQSGNILAMLLAVPLLLISWRNRPFFIYLLILIPLFVSMLKVAIVDQGDVELSFKVTAGWALTCLALPVVQLYGPSHGLHLLSGIAAATILHVAVGLWQMHGFQAGYFPLTGLYINSSFLSVQDTATTIHRYIQRPFGLFPEPSAMSSSLAPWVLLWIAHLCGIVHLKQKSSRAQRVLFGIAAVGGLALIILSRSGHAAVTLAAALCLLAVWFIRSRATPSNFAALFGVLGILLPLVLWQATVALGDRLGGASAVGNSSWEERSTSLLIGFQLLVNTDVPTLLFGFGSGQSSPRLLEYARLEAVWSVVLTYIYETGLLGMAFIIWLALILVQAWRSSSRNLAFGCFAGVWFVGVMVTTSYSQLIPIWIALGWLTVWPQICSARPAAEEADLIAPATASPGSPRGSAWRRIEALPAEQEEVQ